MVYSNHLLKNLLRSISRGRFSLITMLLHHSIFFVAYHVTSKLLQHQQITSTLSQNILVLPI